MKRNVFSKSISTNAMRNSILAFFGLILLSCSNDDNGDNPKPVEEEETITTIAITLAPETGGDSVTFQSRDLDGDGPNPPEITVSNLTANTSYAASIVLLNETESPAENVTKEIEEEDEEHQFFFTTTGALIGVSYTDTDENGNPVGLSFTVNTGPAGDGSLSVTLRHLPKKPNDGTLTDAGGETDVAQTFNVTVE